MVPFMTFSGSLDVTSKKPFDEPRTPAGMVTETQLAILSPSSRKRERKTKDAQTTLQGAQKKASGIRGDRKRVRGEKLACCHATKTSAAHGATFLQLMNITGGQQRRQRPGLRNAVLTGRANDSLFRRLEKRRAVYRRDGGLQQLTAATRCTRFLLRCTGFKRRT